MSRDDESPILRTTPRRLAKGLAIVIGVMVVGAIYGITNFETMNDLPPPSSKLKPEVDLQSLATFEKPTAAPVSSAATSQPAGTQEKPTADVTLTILEGAATQGNPAYDPSDLTVKKGQTILVDNVDAMPHTVTNGAGPSDSTSGKLFDTSIINAGEAKVLETADIDPAKYDYYCTVHPYMLGTLTVEE
jgi:plastocyanin